jgi:hypothetical protein
LWAEHRQVTKQAMVSLFGNRYQVDPALVGATVELVFDPFDLAKIQVRYQQRPMGAAVPFQLGRHVHPAAAPAQPVTGRPSGIDYLAMVERRITATQRRRIAYASLPLPELPAPSPTLEPTRTIMPPPVTPAPARPPSSPTPTSGCTRPPRSRRIRQATTRPTAPPRHRSPTSSPPTPTRTGRR